MAAESVARSVSPSLQAKRDRLLCDERVILTCDDVDGITAQVRGDHDTYRLQLTPAGWRCPCEARITACSHVLCVEAVTGWTR